MEPYVDVPLAPEDLELIISIQNRVVAARDLNGVMTTIVEACRAFAGADGSVVEFMRGDKLVYEAVSGDFLQPYVGLALDPASSISGLAVRELATVVSTDCMNDPRADREAMKLVGIASAILAPLIVNQRPFGVLKIVSATKNYFTNRHRQILERIASFLSLTLASARDRDADSAKFRHFANTVPQLAWMVAPDGHVRWCNDQWYEVTGTTRLLMQQEPWAVVHPDHVKRVSQKWLKHLETGEDWEDTFPLRCADGVFRWYLSRAKATRDTRGQVIHWFGSNTDVTSQLEAEQTLRDSESRLSHSEARYKNLIESLPQLVWTALPTGECDYLSDQWIKYTGVGLEEQLGFRWVDYAIHSEDRDRVVEHWLGAVADRHPYNIDFRIRRFDGVYRWFKVRSTPVRNSRNEIIYWFGTCTDIQDSKELELRLEETARLANEANQLKSAFLANMSHEIRTPLGAILGFTDLLSDKDLSDREREAFHEIVRRNGDQLSSLINDILDLSKVESGHFEIEARPTDVREVLEDVRKTLSAQAQEKGLALTCEARGGLPRMISTDTYRLRQVLINLVGNAIKFTSAGSVRVEADVFNDSEILFSVADSGIGMSEDQVKNLFQRFTQADVSTTRKYGGTGLGLALSKKLAQALGGSLILKESTLGRGSVFELRILDQGVSVTRGPELSASI